MVVVPLWRVGTAAAASVATSNYASAGQAGGAIPPLTILGNASPVTATTYPAPASGATSVSITPAGSSSTAVAPAASATATGTTAASPASATGTAAAPAAASQAQVSVTVARETPSGTLYVGEPVTLKVVLHNPTSAPLMVPDWEHFSDMVAATVRVSGAPGLASPAGAPATPGVWDSPTFQKSDFRPLPPGDTVVLRTFTPLVFGKADITVAVRSPSDAYVSLADGKAGRVAEAWTGQAAAAVSLDISDAESPALAARLAEVRTQLADPLVRAEEKGRLLADVAAEQNYAAPRFLRDVYNQLPAGPLRDAALWQLVKLAQVGTAYESVPLLLTAMGDAHTDQQVRVGILDWTASALADGGRMNLADQAQYTWPADVQKDARAALEKLKTDRNPYLAARAKDALKTVDAAPKP
jgi:hypothetical protein